MRNTDKFQHLSLSQQQAIKPVVDYLTLKCNHYYFSETVVAMLPLLFHIVENNEELLLSTRPDNDGVRDTLFVYSKKVKNLKYHTSGKKLDATEQTALVFKSSPLYIHECWHHFYFEIHPTSTGYKLVDSESTLKKLLPDEEFMYIHEVLLSFCSRLLEPNFSTYKISTQSRSSLKREDISFPFNLFTTSGVSIRGGLSEKCGFKKQGLHYYYLNSHYLIQEEDIDVKVIRGKMLNARANINGASVALIDGGLIISVNFCHFVVYRHALFIITPGDKVIILAFHPEFDSTSELSRVGNIHRTQTITSTPFNGFGELNIPANKPTVKEVEQPLVEKGSSADKEQEDKPIEVNQDELDLKLRFAQIGTKITEVAAVVELWQQEENDIAFGHILELYDQIDTLDEDGRKRLNSIITAFDERLANQLEEAEKEQKFSQNVTFQVLESLFGIKK